ncbi:glnD PII-uridylyltransferase family protein [Mycobacterium kansasii 732]|nr:glnD PII-uridylyltransferase family protein [Mycobacterium kansasii 732]
MTPDQPGQCGTACPASDLVAARRQLLSDDQRAPHPAELRQAWLDLHESWLTAKAAEIGITGDSGFAIVGVGGLGRRELLPHSDLDLLLVHDAKPAEMLGEVADKLWYPLWDANIRLDHSVRTVPDALGVANSDLVAALGMLEARHIAGDKRLSDGLIEGVRRQWRSGIRSRMDELVEITHDRWLRYGRIAHRAEPDLKSGRGGLRDVQLLNALAIAQLIDRHGMAARACRWVRWTTPTSRCSTCAPNCTGYRAADTICCWPSTPTTSAQPCVSATDSTWRGCCPAPAAPSPTTPKPGCAPPPTRCRAGVSRPYGTGRSGDRWTRAS